MVISSNLLINFRSLRRRLVKPGPERLNIEARIDFGMPEITILKRPREEAVITQRLFFKKTARGKVMKGAAQLSPHHRLSPHAPDSAVLRERYLRNDISCGINGCRACDAAAKTILPRSGDTTHTLFPTGHYILPDTNVFLAQVRP